MKLLNQLTQWPAIIGSFVVMIITGASFGYFQTMVGGDLLDLSMTGREALARLSEMSAGQKNAHTWITLIPDSIYPLAYGSFFAGLTLKFAGSNRAWAALPALVTVMADFCENIIQLLSLNGFEALIVAKSFLTPLKFTAFFCAAIMLVLFALTALTKRALKKNDSENG